VMLIALLAALLLLVGLVGATSDDEPLERSVPVAQERPRTTKQPERAPEAPTKRMPQQDADAPSVAPVVEPTDTEETGSGASQAAAPEPKPKPRRTRSRDHTSRPEGTGDAGELTPGLTAEPPPPPPPAPPPETTPPEPPPEPPRTCRDAAGLPIPCPGNPGGPTRPPP
jgi:hypothetical protein